MTRALLLAVSAAALVASLGVSCKRTQGDAAAGRELFTNTCARCHGANGGGGLALWEGGPAPRDLRTAQFQDSVSDEQIKATIVAGKGTGMPPFGKTFDDAALAALVAQIRSLDERKK